MILYITAFNLQKPGKQIQPIVPEQTIRTLKDYFSKCKDNTYLFGNDNGEQLIESQILMKIHAIA